MESLHYLVMKTHAHLYRKILGQAAELGFSPGQPKILEFLQKYGRNNQKAIADYCEIEPATVGSILTRMEKSGLILREQLDGNRRSLYVSLTQEGREAAEKVEGIFREADAQAVSLLTQEEQECLQTLLKKVCSAMEQEEKETTHD